MPLCHTCIHGPRYGMNHCFDTTKPAEPPVEEVVGIERDPEEVNEGIVPSSKEDKRDHVHHCEMP